MKTTSTKKPEPVSKLYAKALFELATETNNVEQVLADLATFNELVQASPELNQALSAQMFSVEDRVTLAAQVTDKAQLNPLVRRFIEILVSKNRITLTDQIYDSFREYIDQRNNTVRGTLTTAEPLTEAEIADLAKAFGRKFNKTVVLEPATDKQLLGGLVVKIQGLTFDGSLKTTIRRLKENLERQPL